MTDVARALVASPRFQWGEGMLAVRPDRPDLWYRILRTMEGDPTSWTDEDAEIYDVEDMPFPDDVIPWLADPATAGVLLAVMWAADPALHVHRDGDAYTVHVAPGCCEVFAPTLGEAVARTLLSVWT